jgi:dipeptidyl-peptidase 4
MRPVHALAAAGILILCAPPLAAAAPAHPPVLSYDAIFTEDVNGRAPSQLAWSPDGRTLAYVYDDGRGAALWSLDTATGKTEELLHPAALPQTAPKGQKAESVEIDSAQWSPRGDSLLLEANGDLYLLALPGRALRRLTSTDAEEKDPKFSPDGTRVAFVRGADLHLLDLASGREQALTTGGKENEILNGTPDWLYYEEIWHRFPTAYWWSPDGTRIAYERFDENGVPVHPLVDERVQAPKVTWQKYPKPGETNPKVRVGVLDLASGKTAWMETGGAPDHEYIARVEWTPDGSALAVQAMNRGQSRLDLLRCTAADGRCGTLVSESSPAWVNPVDDLRFLPGGRFLWSSERNGWRRLYLYEADGRLVRQVSPDGWVVTSVDRTPEAGEKEPWVLFTGYRTDGPAAVLGAIDRQVVRAGLGGGSSGGRIEVLTAGPGSHAAQAAPRTGHWVHTWSTADEPERSEVRLAGGGRVLPLPSAPPSKYDPAALPRSEFLTIPGPDGTALPARLIKPAGFDPGRRYPVITFQYGGPSSQTVVNRWDKGRRTLFHKRMAQLGFAVLTVDGRNTIFFGKEGEALDFRHMGEANLEAQLAGVAYLKAQPWADTANLGLWGWSGGGFTTLYCLLHRPGVWKAGVAGAPVTDWHLYDSVYTERFLRTPQENEDGYRSSSPINEAGHLKDHLLIVHGLSDDNVHAQNSVEMIDRLVHAGLPVEEAFYPGEKHGMKPVSIRHFFERMEEFWTRTLQAVEVGDVEVR